MMLQLERVLKPEQLENVRRTLARAEFVNGKLSAGKTASAVKNNEELKTTAQLMELLNNEVMGSLVSHPIYQAGALPQRVASPFYARYTPGMFYGDHVDDPVMGIEGQHYRSDISITVFLNDPEEYEGGELVINSSYGQNKVKLAAGDAVMYPSSSLHHVTEVTKGERLVAVTWVQSMVRHPAQRELLYTLYQAKEKLLESAPNEEISNQVNTAYVNLMRMWVDI
ncbi:MAG: Fe2+-dependent dioxygenase [Acidiferrobacterales bacterium]